MTAAQCKRHTLDLCEPTDVGFRPGNGNADARIAGPFLASVVATELATVLWLLTLGAVAATVSGARRESPLCIELCEL